MKNLLEKRLCEAGYDFSSDIQDSFAAIITELKKWNKTINLTAINSDEEIIVKHLIDSQAVAKYLKHDEKLLDVGSGGGFPAIPLKVILPETEITSVDAVLKKITFQKHLGRVLKLKDFHPLHCRVESMYGKYPGYFDKIVSRAFSRLDLFVTLVAPLLKKDGRIIAMKGPGFEAEINESDNAIQKLGFFIETVYPYNLPSNSGERHIIELKRHE